MFGNYQKVDVNILKYHDKDASGGQNGTEGGLSGWQFFIDLDNDGQLDAGAETASVVTTDANGEAAFEDLEPGDPYKVCEVTQAGWVNSDPGTTQACKTTVELVSQMTEPLLKFGNYQKVDVNILKYHDKDASGGQNGTEGGLSGWQFFIDLDNDGQLDAGAETASVVTTDANGEAAFEDLEPGDPYKVCEVTQAGWVNSDPGTTQACKTTVELVSQMTEPLLKFGNYQKVDVRAS